MKRCLTALLLILLAASLAACSPSAGPAETPASTQVEAQNTPTETPTPSPSPTPEPKPFVPMDIFSSEFNPYGMDWPFTVFEASFNKGSEKPGAKDQFVLSMTGSGNMFACVAYLADVAGLGLDDGGKMELLEEYRANGYYCEFTGKDGQIVTIRQAIPEDDRYEYVESDGSHDFSGGGCVIDITYFVEGADIDKYTKLVRDNYSIDALMPISDFFDTNMDFSECGVGVNVHKNEARSYAVYYLPDVKAVQQSLQANGNGWWGEWNGQMQTGFMYNGIESKLTFDPAGGAITVEQLNTEFNLPPAAEVSLTKFGFGFDDEGTCGVFELREPHYMSIAIHRPEWGEWDGDWNIEYMDVINGYSLRITYFADEGRYNSSLQKGDQECAFDYYPASDEKGWEHPDLDTAHRMFNDAFGTKGKEMYYAPLAHFEQVVQERFGMSIDDLYALPIR